MAPSDTPALRSRDSGLGLPARPDQFQVSAHVLAIALALSLWMASGNLVLAVVDGLGSDPLRRLVIGLALVLAIAAALWKRDAVCVALRARPWLVVLVTLAMLGAVVADGPLESAYGAVSVTSLGLAAIVARARTVWLCVAILDVGFAAAILADHSPAALVESGELAAALGALLGYPFAALVVLGLAGMFTRYVSSADAIIDKMRAGSPALTPALAQALQLGAGRQVGLLGPPAPFAELTAREVDAVAALAHGRRPKQIAFDWGVSLATVRKDLANAKRKTGARTLAELAAMTDRVDWPR
jgi:DNA-binding NarL/FixJ family response regulator